MDKMDKYLQYLYDYTLETRMAATLQNTLDYKFLHIEMVRTWEALEAALTAEQQKAVDDFLSAKERISSCEDEWLFQEGVALGKWLARP